MALCIWYTVELIEHLSAVKLAGIEKARGKAQSLVSEGFNPCLQSFSNLVCWSIALVNSSFGKIGNHFLEGLSDSCQLGTVETKFGH